MSELELFYQYMELKKDKERRHSLISIYCDLKQELISWMQNFGQCKVKPSARDYAEKLHKFNILSEQVIDLINQEEQMLVLREQLFRFSVDDVCKAIKGLQSKAFHRPFKVSAEAVIAENVVPNVNGAKVSVNGALNYLTESGELPVFYVKIDCESLFNSGSEIKFIHQYPLDPNAMLCDGSLLFGALSTSDAFGKTKLNIKENCVKKLPISIFDIEEYGRFDVASILEEKRINEYLSKSKQL